MNIEFPAFSSCLAISLGIFSFASAELPAASIEYNQDIRPIFNKHCLQCHGGVRKKSGFSLLFRAEAMGETRSGKPAIVPGHPDRSELMRRLTVLDADERMPAESAALSPAEIESVRLWIEQGALWDEHWAYRKPLAVSESEPTMPSGLDELVAKRLKEEGLEFSPPADPAVWLRRVSLDLTGLPPGPGEVDAFLEDPSIRAREMAVDRLLESPHFGERWAAYWLDLARYADTQGYEKDNRRNIWLYRDWVIKAFNRDLPFDQFTIEQLAGDLLPQATDDQRIATGFHRNTMTNTEGGTDDEEFRVVALIDRVNTTWDVWMGSSFGCVQCHSHPYDPFRHEDYYRFMAFFNNTADADRSNDSPVLELLSEEQKQRKQWLRGRVAELETRLKELSPDMEKTRMAWEEGLATMSEAEWTVLPPDELKALHGVTLKRMPDGSILAQGPNPVKNTYTLQLTVPDNLPGVTALRLEALTDDSLPNRGPGRPQNGNFVLTEFEVYRGDDKVVLEHATASFEQTEVGHLTPYGRWGAEGVLDEDVLDAKVGWAIMPQLGKPHQLVVETQDELKAGPLKVVIKQNHGNGGHTLGKFRLSATASPRPVRADAERLSPLLAILKKPVSDRSAQEKEALLEQFRQEAPLLAEWRREQRTLEQELKGIRGPTTLVMEELRGDKRRSTHVFDRGNWMTHGSEVEPGLPAVFGHHSDLAKGRGTRLELARWLVSPENPMTARVMVNRFWEQLFGIGLVETVEDFGILGEVPLNQPLLDALAVRFQGEHGWSAKRLLREIVLSRSYGQTSRVTPELVEKDPYNRLLARGPRFRLSAETIRDQALAVSGLLSRKLYGPSVMPPQPEGIWQVVYNGESWKTPDNEDRYRRGLYTYWRRTSPYPSMMAFDAPSREFCANRRIRTNTPLAALVTLNDPAFLEAAQGLARRMMREGGPGLENRLIHGFRLVQARRPTKDDLAELEQLHGKTQAHFSEHSEAAKALGEDPELAVLTVVANVLLNLDGTLTKE